VASRVNAPGAAKRTAAADDFCDVSPAPAAAPAFTLPALAAPGAAPAAAAAPSPAGGWRWINVWATWCKPCLEELPLLQRWPAQLTQDGIKVALQMVSVDQEEAPLTSFRQRHPQLPAAARLADPAALGPWLAGLGGRADSSIPIHILVDPAGKVRCVRAGTVTPSDYRRLAAVLLR
jgi:thiol-disulfide isomerase/thioredoxin